MKINAKVVLWVVMALILSGLILAIFFPNIGYAIKDFGKQEEGKDICSPPEGTSLEDWKEHMSHHPNIYKDCLN